MDPERIDHYCDLFETRLKAGERVSIDQFLDEHQLQRDDHLLKELESILREYAARSERVDEDGEASVSGSGGELPATYDFSQAKNSAAVDGRIIGNYKLLQVIGEGGMGTVFMAEQQLPVRRRVALKIIKPGMDSKQVVARFEAERQALAMMDHPNIAKVLDAGTTDRGDPYFVMELVRGVPITSFCDANRLTIRQRLELFVPLCEAIQHAHQKGIIHRDIKPSNILVCNLDGRTVPKVIDFGVAKAIEQRLTDKTMFTEFGAAIGTLQYMSPEQAGLSQLDVDTRSDVYSLGVLLYELLTGSTPITRERIRSAARHEVVRLIHEEEPPKPSTRLSGSQEVLSAISAKRGSEPKKLSGLLRGELDWIVLKALEKDRSRRYETAIAFGRDVKRYLNDDVVEARPPSSMYRLRKALRRHRTAVSVATTFLGLLALGVVLSTLLAIRALRAEQAATAISEFLRQDLLEQVSPYQHPDPKVTLRTVLDRAGEQLQGRFPGQPLVEASIRNTMGNAYRQLGEYREAESHLERAKTLRLSQLGADHEDTLKTTRHLAQLQMNRGRYPLALELYEETVHRMKASLGPLHRETMAATSELAEVNTQLARFEQAQTLIDRTLQDQTDVIGKGDRDTLASLMRQAALKQARGEYLQSEGPFKNVIREMKEYLPENDVDILMARHSLGELYCDLGRFRESRQLFEELIETENTVLGEDHPQTLSSLTWLIDVTDRLKRSDEAVQIAERILPMAERRLGPNDPQTMSIKRLQGVSYMSLKKDSQAKSLLEACVATSLAQLGEESRDTLTAMDSLATFYAEIAEDPERARSIGLESTSLLDKSKELTLRTWKVSERVLGPHHPETITTLHNLALIYEQEGKYGDAEKYLRQAWQHSKEFLPGTHPDLLTTLESLAAVLTAQRRYTEAEPLYLQAASGYRQALGDDHQTTLESLRGVGLVYEEQRRYADALKWYENGLEILRSKSSNPELQRTFEGDVDRISSLLQSKLDKRLKPKQAE